MYFLAYKLKKTIGEIEEMSMDEYQYWMAFLDIKSELEKEAFDK